MNMSWLEEIRCAARMKSVCAAVSMRCPAGRRMFRLRDNPLLRADEAAFLSVKGGCVLAGTFGREGFFSGLCAADAGAAEALLAMMEEKLRAWGAARVTGPVSPSLIDLNGGAAALAPGEAGASPFGDYLPAFAERALQERGFVVSARSFLYELDARGFDWPRWERAAAYSTGRFGYRVVSARAVGDRTACRAMARLSRTDPALAHTDEETALMLAGLGRRWSRALTQLALRGDEPVGCLLALEAEGVLRATTIQVRSDFRNRAVTAALALPLLRGAGNRRVECGVVAEGNLASRLTVERAGARVAAVFQRYSKELA